ncbi:MAG: vWA domain-containing protein [Nanobdellota archaeon]
MHPSSANQLEQELEDGHLDMERGEKDKLDIEDTHGGDELEGHMLAQPDEENEKLAHSVLDVDTDTIEDGMIVEEAANHNVGSFMPSMMFKDIVQNFKNAKKLYGETIIRELTGYDPRYVEKNVKIPEFQRDLKERINENVDNLKEKGILNRGGFLSSEAIDVATIFLIEEEYNEVQGQTTPYGEHVHQTLDRYGQRSDARPFLKSDPYRDLAIKQSITKAIMRGHDKLHYEDLVAYDRQSRQQVNVVYALDTSGSMKGDKIKLAKKAGVSLAHKAIGDRNQVGLVLFGSEVKSNVPLTRDFLSIVRPLAKISPGKETDLGLAIDSSIELLHDTKGIKHIVVITDALHTTTRDPQESVLAKVAKAKEEDISISMVGINLDKDGAQLAQSIVDISGGKLHTVKNLDEVGGIVIADYASLL